MARTAKLNAARNRTLYLEHGQWLALQQAKLALGLRTTSEVVRLALGEPLGDVEKFIARHAEFVAQHAKSEPCSMLPTRKPSEA